MGERLEAAVGIPVGVWPEQFHMVAPSRPAKNRSGALLPLPFVVTCPFVEVGQLATQRWGLATKRETAFRNPQSLDGYVG